MSAKAGHAGVICRTRMRYEDEFVTLRNVWMRDERLSFRARGILGYLMTHDDGFTTSTEQLARVAKEGRDATRTAVAELEQFGYLTRRRVSDGHRFTILWQLADPFASTPQPVDNSAPYDGKPGDGFPGVRTSRAPGNPPTGNPSIEENKTKKYKTPIGNQQSDDAEPVDKSRTITCSHCGDLDMSPSEDEQALCLCSRCYWTSSIRRARVAEISTERITRAAR